LKANNIDQDIETIKAKIQKANKALWEREEAAHKKSKDGELNNRQKRAKSEDDFILK